MLLSRNIQRQSRNIQTYSFLLDIICYIVLNYILYIIIYIIYYVFAVFSCPCLDKIERMPVKASCPKYDQALTSKEFITKYQSTVAQESELSDSQSNKVEEASSWEPPVSEEEEQIRTS